MGIVGAVALVLAATAFAAHYEGTTGDDDFTARKGSASAYLYAGNDSFRGAKGAKAGSDAVWGGPGDDTMRGHGRHDVLRGHGGQDYLNGGPGRDGLRGGDGDDTLIGGGGVDVFKPDEGEDTCIGQMQDKRFPGKCEIVIIKGG